MTFKSTITVIIPVFKEGNTINDTIVRLLALPCNGCVEIIVIDGDPGKSTISVINQKDVITAISAKGRASQMNRGAEMASGQILVFLHADTFLPPRGLLHIQAAMSEGRFAAGAFDLGINSDRPVFRITERYVALRTRLTKIPFGDQAIFMKKKYFEEIGGYQDLPLMEDVELMTRIKKRRGRIRLIPEKVMTSPRRWELEGILYCTLRNWLLQISYALGVSPERLAQWYKEKG